MKLYICLIIVIVFLITGCSQAVERESNNEFSLEERFVLQELYLDEVVQYLNYLRRFQYYAATIQIDSMTMYNDSCKMSAYATHVILNKLTGGEK